MADLVEDAIRNAVQSLLKRDSELAQRTFEREKRINALDIEIDDRCLRLLALRHPVARVEQAVHARRRARWSQGERHAVDGA